MKPFFVWQLFLSGAYLFDVIAVHQMYEILTVMYVSAMLESFILRGVYRYIKRKIKGTGN